MTGEIDAKDKVDLAFQLEGRVIERTVRIGDRVMAGQLVARLDPEIQQNSLRTAQATLAAVEAQLADARINYWRQQELLKGGWTPRANYDKAHTSVQTLQNEVDAAQAQVRTAQEQLGYTDLYADGPGAVTKIGAEPGEVVQAGRMVVRVARDGGRDAVFDVPEQIIRSGPRDPIVEISLANDPKVKAIGHVREVAPQADPTTRTYRAKIAITDPPEGMRLGATITGRITLPAPPGVEVPASALTKNEEGPAVWVVDPHSQMVKLCNVDVVRYDPASVLISNGLQAGDVVVTAGVQSLHPGQKVRLLGAAS